MDQIRATKLPVWAHHLPAFDGFPYLAIRLGPAFYHLAVLPQSESSYNLSAIARQQAVANDFHVCLVLAPSQGIYCRPDGSVAESPDIPRGGIVTCGILKLPVPLQPTAELAQRKLLLEEYVARHKPKQYVYGDLTKGGRCATPEQVRRLAGSQPNGVPNGLERCDQCHDWRGECLDPNPLFEGKVMRVHCRCHNHNRCSWCGEPLYERKLDANYYSLDDRKIWHVPGFLALKHRCVGDRREVQP